MDDTWDIGVAYVHNEEGEREVYISRDDLVRCIENMPIDSRNLFIYAGLLDLAELLKEMSLPESPVSG